MQARALAAPDTNLSSARLIAAAAPNAGVWTLGIAITLKGRAHTYWRNPGEAGVPPRFDWSASTNLARADVLYPVPKRIGEADLEAIGYEDTVVFPVRVAPVDPAKPITAAVTMDYAACDRICLPARADLSMRLPPTSENVDDAGIADAQARVPQRLDDSAAKGAATVSREGTNPAAWRVQPTVPVRDLFAEAPDGFFVATKRDGEAFRIAVVEHPDGKPVPDWLRITLARETGGQEFRLPIAP